MPMIRYEQNDLGRIEERPCDCGWSFRVLIDLQGRKNDSFILPSGKTISSGFLLDATYEILLTHRTAVKDFCHIQMTRSEIILEVVTGEGWSADVRRAIEGRFATFFEPGVRFFIALVEVCPKNKIRKSRSESPAACLFARVPPHGIAGSEPNSPLFSSLVSSARPPPTVLATSGTLEVRFAGTVTLFKNSILSERQPEASVIQ
jgi:phenylacetate-CoA ligase